MSDIDDLDLEEFFTLEEYKYNKAYQQEVERMIKV